MQEKQSSLGISLLFVYEIPNYQPRSLIVMYIQVTLKEMSIHVHIHHNNKKRETYHTLQMEQDMRTYRWLNSRNWRGKSCNYILSFKAKNAYKNQRKQLSLLLAHIQLKSINCFCFDFLKYQFLTLWGVFSYKIKNNTF